MYMHQLALAKQHTLSANMGSAWPEVGVQDSTQTALRMLASPSRCKRVRHASYKTHIQLTTPCHMVLLCWWCPIHSRNPGLLQD